MTRAIYGAALLLASFLIPTATGADEAPPFDAAVLQVRPRVFLRNEPFGGLTIEKLRGRFEKPELWSRKTSLAIATFRARSALDDRWQTRRS